MWWDSAVRRDVWIGFTDAGTGNLAFSVGDDPARVGARRRTLEDEAARRCGRPVRLQYMNQVHGRKVAVVRDALDGPAPSVDALVSRSAGLAVMVADCVPVILVGADAQDRPIVAVAHAGRAGVEQDVLGATVGALRDQGALEVSAWIGPGVCGRCYEVPTALRDQVAAVEPAAFSTTSWGTPALDLPAAVDRRLGSLDVHAARIPGCTLEESGLFSHRRSGRTGEPEGRFAGVVAIGPAAVDRGTEAA